MIRYIITTNDGLPLRKSDGEILVMLTQISARQIAKNLTFKLKTRHHTRSLDDSERYDFNKKLDKDGFASWSNKI